MNAIIERQSPDWGSSGYDAAQAATLMAGYMQEDTGGRLEWATHTRNLHALWESCFTTPFSSCRRFLKDLAHQSWQGVRDCNVLFSEAQHQAVSDSVFGGHGWVLFTDDDDWYAPDVFVRVEEMMAQKPSCCMVWNRVRFDGNVAVTPIEPAADHPLWVYTNNYAVRANAIARGTRVGSVMRHQFTNRMVEARKWDAFLAPNTTISVTNKSPCSWNCLHGASLRPDPTRHLIGLVEQYAWTAYHLDDGLRWAESYARAAQLFFRDILRTRLR